MFETTIVGSVAIAATFVVLYVITSVVLCFKYGAPETETKWHFGGQTTTIVDDDKPRPYMRRFGEKIIIMIYTVLFIITMVAICYGVGRVVKALL